MISIIIGKETEYCKRREQREQMEGSEHKGSRKEGQWSRMWSKVVHKNPAPETEIIKSQLVRSKISQMEKKKESEK